MNPVKPIFAGNPYENPYNKYIRRNQIGFGAYGTVFEAELNGNIYAIKEIDANVDDLDWLMREVETIIKLEGCPNIVKYYEIWFSNQENLFMQIVGQYQVRPIQAGFEIINFNRGRFTPVAIYIVMERYNMSLNDVMSNGNFTDSNREKIFKGILSGLKSIADNNVVHRDLTPDNIFLDNDGMVKIGDFGLAIDKDLKGSSDLRGRGTLCFRPPESLNIELVKIREITQKHDVYSFGLIYYFMCLGTVAVDKTINLIRKYGLCYKKHEKFTLRDREILNRMLATEPEKRISIWKLYEYVFNDTFSTVSKANVRSNFVPPTQLALRVTREGRELQRQLSNGTMHIRRSIPSNEKL